MATDNKNILDLENREVGEEIQSDTRDLNNQNVPPPKAPPPTITRPMESVSEPIFSRDERVALTLLPLASALLQGKAPGGQSLLSSTLATAGQGLAGSGNVALRIKELEGQRRRETGTGLKSVKLQPTAGPVEIQGKVFTPDMGRSFELDEATRKMYPPDTFTEVTADRKGTIKTEKFDLTYVGSEEEAKRLYPNNTEIQKLIVATNENQIGKPVVKDNQRLIANVIFKDGKQTESRVGFASKQPTGMRDIAKGTLEYQPDIATAKKYLADRGIKEGIEGYNYVLGKIVNKDLAGKTVFEQNAALVMSAEAPDVAGAPITSVNLVPEKDIKSFTFETRKGYVKKLQDNLSKATSQYGQLEKRIDAVLDVLPNTPTGVVEANLLPFKKYLVGLGFGDISDVNKLSAQELIKSSSDALAPLMREAGSGSTSDMEFESYRNAAVSLKNLPLANYVSLYMLKAIKESVLQRTARRIDLAQNLNRSTISIEEQIKKEDKGIFRKYTGPKDDAEELAWLKTVPRGEVILNRDRLGNAIFTDDDGNELAQFIVSDGEGGAIFQ